MLKKRTQIQTRSQTDTCQAETHGHTGALLSCVCFYLVPATRCAIESWQTNIRNTDPVICWLDTPQLYTYLLRVVLNDFLRAYTWIYIYIYIYTHRETHKHKHTHTHTQCFLVITHLVISQVGYRPQFPFTARSKSAAMQLGYNAVCFYGPHDPRYNEGAVCVCACVYIYIYIYIRSYLVSTIVWYN